MRRLAAFLTLTSALALMAVAPTPAPSPAKAASALATPIPLIGNTPAPAHVGLTLNVVVYPLHAGAGFDGHPGMKVAKIFKLQMEAAGNIHVVAIPKGVLSAKMLADARARKADFYITGYLIALGNGASMVEQVVNASNGVIIFSQTAQIANANDAAAQALDARSAMLGHEGLNDQGIPVAQAQATPPPSKENKHGASVSLGGLGALASLFHRGAKGTASPTPAPVKEKPARRALVARVGGMLSAGILTSATQELFAQANRFFTVGPADASAADLPAKAGALCGSHRDSSILTGILAQTQSTHLLRRETTYTFTLNVYACFGATLYTGSAQGPTLQKAVDQALDAYAIAHPNNG